MEESVQSETIVDQWIRKEKKMVEKSLMIFGLGDLGGYVLEFLARVPNMPKIITADKNEEWGDRKTNSAILGASHFGLYPDIRFIPLDAFDVDPERFGLDFFIGLFDRRAVREGRLFAVPELDDHDLLRRRDHVIVLVEVHLDIEVPA